MINFFSFLIPKDLHIVLKLIERAEYNTYKVRMGTSEKAFKLMKILILLVRTL